MDKREDTAEYYQGGTKVPREPVVPGGYVPPEAYKEVRREAHEGASHAEKKGNPHETKWEEIENRPTIPEETTEAKVSAWGFFKGTIETIKAALAAVFAKKEEIPDVSGKMDRNEVVPEEIADGVKIATIAGVEIKAPQGGGGGAVDSVNGMKGAVVITANDIKGVNYSAEGSTVAQDILNIGGNANYARQMSNFACKTILGVQFIQTKDDLDMNIGQVEGFAYVFTEKKLWAWMFMRGTGVVWMHIVPESEYPAVVKLFTHNNSILETSMLSTIKPIEDAINEVLGGEV